VTSDIKKYAEQMLNELEKAAGADFVGRMADKIKAERATIASHIEAANLHRRHLVDIALLALNEQVTHQNRMFLNDLMRMHGGDGE
jgi:hypothetical protein